MQKIITLKKNHGLKQTTLIGFVEIVLPVVPRRLPFHLVGDGAFAFFVATKWYDVRYILREILILLWVKYWVFILRPE